MRGRWMGAVGAVAAVVAVAASACSGGGHDDPAGRAAGEQAAAVPAPVRSPGCARGATERADLIEQTLPVEGTPRRWLVSAPAWRAGSDPLPLVLDFHGLAEGADIHAQTTQLGQLGIEKGFVTVFPHGTGDPVGWNVSPVVGANRDLRYVGALLDRVELERCIDTARVYATGLSNGAMMASTVGCALSDRIAAIAPVSGLMLPQPCRPSHPMPVLTMHGTADPILLFNGGVGTGALSAALHGAGGGVSTTTVPADLDGPGYPDTVRRWARLDGCRATFHEEPISGAVIRRTFDCPADTSVVFLIVKGGGHSWPSSKFSRSIQRIVGSTTFDIDASQEVWRFLRRFRLPA